MPSLIRIPRKVFKKKVRFLFEGWLQTRQLIRDVLCNNQPHIRGVLFVGKVVF